MAYEPDELEGFLTHSTQDRSGGFLKGWKKDGHITVFQHRKVLPIAVYVHNFPRVHVADGKEGEEAVRHVYGGEYNCWEDEKVLKAQYRRDKEGIRTSPPQRCPLCRLIETVRDMVYEGQLHWLEPIFKFDSDIDKESRTLRAGGLYNRFGDKDLSPAELKEMARAGVNAAEDWNQNAYAKGKYLFYVVNADKPGDGVQRTLEAAGLGDKVKDVIAAAMDSAERPELGDPRKNPYAIKWMYDDSKGISWNNRYNARKIDKVKLTPEIDALISGDRPDTARDTAPFDGKAMRTLLEQHCLVRAKIPWDDIFSGVRLPGALANHPDLPSDRDLEFPPKAEPARPAQQAAKQEEPDVEVACDTCNKAMMLSDAACPHCGHVYDAAKLAAQQAAQPRPRKRSDAAR